MGWTQVHQLDHGPSLHEGDPVSCRALVYQEEEAPVEGVDARLAMELGGSVLQQTKYSALEERPIFLDSSRSCNCKSALRSKRRDWGAWGGLLESQWKSHRSYQCK